MSLSKIQSVYRSAFRVVDSIESGADGTRIPVIRGAASRVDQASIKGYRYRSGFWDKIISDSQLQQRVADRDMLGMIEHPEDEYEYNRTPLDKASHVVLRAWVDEKTHEPWIDCGLLNNERGNAIKALVDVGFRPGCSTRAMGGFLHDSLGDYLDENNYAVITWDIVRSPNFDDIRLERVSDSSIFKEAVQMYQLRDSVADCYNHDKLCNDLKSAIDALQRVADFLEKK